MKDWISKIKKTFGTSGVRMVLIIAIPIIVVLALLMIYVLLKPEEEVELRLVIDNFEEVLPDVPSVTRRRIEERLYATVERSGVFGTDGSGAGDSGADGSGVEAVPEDGAMIRLGSKDGFTLQGTFHVGNFIVDIASVKQSYIVKYFYGQMAGKNETEPSASVMLYCIEDPSEVIYSDFACKANRDFVRPDPIQYVLPYETSDFALTYTYSLTSASGYAVVVTYDPPEEVYLEGRVEEFENETMQEIYIYLAEAGVKPDDYEFISKYEIVK